MPGRLGKEERACHPPTHRELAFSPAESKERNMMSHVSRRDVLRGLSGAGAGLSLAYFTGALSASQPSGNSRPNFVVFTCDDAGWGDFGYHGSVIRTPNIDRMAETGVELDQFYVYPTCSPTRASFMTGRPPGRVGFTEALDFETGQTLPRNVPTIAHLLRAAGYDTSLCGKWHLGNRPDIGPNTFGFNHAYGHFTAWVNFYSHRSFNDMRSWHRNGKYIHEEGHSTDLIADEAIRYIREIRDDSKPFFLVVHFNAPHLPLQEEEWRVEQYKDLIETESRRYYAAMVTHVDEAIGRILSVLNADGLTGNTLVTFFSDNGAEPPGEKSYIKPIPAYKSTASTEMYGTSLPLRGGKFELYEGGIRTPALLYMPGTLKPSTITEPCIVYDILPTMCALAGSPVGSETGVEGIDIWGAVGRGTSIPERTLYWRKNNQLAVRRGNWKLLHNGKTPEEGTDELYDLSMDPYETKNRACEYPQFVEELHAVLASEFARDNEPYFE